MSTPTPRTDAAVKLTFAAGHNTVCPNFARTLERELTALTGTYTCTHHNDQQRAACPVCLVAALTAERDHWQEIAKAASAEREHNANVAQAMTAERDQLRAQLHALQLVCGTNDANKFETWVDRANARAEKAEAECATEREKAERYRLTTLKLDAELAEMHKSFAGNVHMENRELQAELATERARLDSGTILLTVSGERVWHCGVDLRAAIDAAMKEGAK